MSMRFEYAIVEWLWDTGNIRINLPHGEEKRLTGMYPEAVNALTGLGSDGWDVSACTSGGNWLFRTMKRPL